MTDLHAGETWPSHGTYVRYKPVHAQCPTLHADPIAPHCCPCWSLLQTPQGWTLSFDCSTFPEDHWGLLLPQLRKLLQRWPALSAATAAAQPKPKLQQQVVICSRKGSDNTLSQLAARNTPQPVTAATARAGSPARSDVDNADADADGEAPVDAAAGSLPGAEADADHVSGGADVVASTAAAAGGAAAADRLVLELGWDTFKPKLQLDDEEAEEEEEEPVVEFALAIYNLQAGFLVYNMHTCSSCMLG